MNIKPILAATALLGAVLSSATASATPVVTAKNMAGYYSLDQKTFEGVRKGYTALSFPFAQGLTALSDPYTVGSTGVTFAATQGLFGLKDASLNGGKALLFAAGDLTASYTGSVLGLTLETATAQTLSFTINGGTKGSISLAAYTPTYLGFDNGGVRLNSATGLQIMFDASACTDKIAVLGFGAAVPEAATWAMMMVGLGIAGAALRRRRAPTGALRFA